MTIYSNKKTKDNKPNIILLSKEVKKWIFKDTAVTANQNIVKTQNENVDRYQEQVFKVNLMYQYRTYSHWHVGSNI